MKHESQGSDYGTNYGTDVFGIPGTNAQGVTATARRIRERHSGMPVFNTGLGIARQQRRTGRRCVRDERSYTASINLTKVAGRHEIRTGFDFVRLSSPTGSRRSTTRAGSLTFGGGITGIPGYAGVGGWNGYAGFLLGQMSSYGKSVQFEETDRAREPVRPLRQRPLAGEREAHAESRPALRELPADDPGRPRHRAARLSTFNVPSAASAATPRISASRPATRCSRRVSASPTASTTTPSSVRASAGRSTRCHGRGPLRGRYPAAIALLATPDQRLHPVRQPRRRAFRPRRARTSQRQHPAAARRAMRSPDPDNVRARHDRLVERVRRATPAAGPAAERRLRRHARRATATASSTSTTPSRAATSTGRCSRRPAPPTSYEFASFLRSPTTTRCRSR